MKKILFFVCVLMCVFGVYYYKKNTYDFNLLSEFSNSTSLKDFKGSKLIVYFGFTYCPDVCPGTLSILSDVLSDINNTNIKLLFVSLDPKRDNNITKTNDYLRYFYKNSQALLVKNEKELKDITKNYGVIYNIVDLNNSYMKYTIAHSNKLYFIDEDGNFIKSVSDLYPENLKKEIENFSKTN